MSDTLNIRIHQQKTRKLSAMDILNLKAQITNKNFEGFNNQIKAPLEGKLTKWIKSQYPQLENEKDFVFDGIFRRIKNDIKKVTEESSALKIDSIAQKYLKVECESILPTSKNIKNNLGLTKAEFDQMLIKLSQGDESIIEKIYLAHFEKAVAIIIKNNKCSRDVAYESTMDALFEIRQDFQKKRIRYGNLQSYFISRAMNKYYKRVRKNSIKISEMSDDLEYVSDQNYSESLIEKELNEMIRKSIKQLGSECQQILKSFYYQEMKLTQISEILNKSHEAVRKQASRCRETLKKYIGRKFYKQYSSYFS